ncbi:MAG: hypothetical protein WCF85_11265 [Rhodospirillaceae bacterium]
MKITNEVLQETINKLKALGITKSDNQASFMMGKSLRYVSWVKATGRNPDIGALVALYYKILALADHSGATGYPDIAEGLEIAARNLNQAIKAAALARQPNKRIRKRKDGK